MRPDTLRKARKLNPKELLCWVSACQLPEVNKERAAIIEYALGVLVSIDYKIGAEGPETRRKIVERILHEAIEDRDAYLKSLEGDQLRLSFALGFLMVRGEAFPWQFAQAALDRYEPHSQWMHNNLGFDIFDAIKFSKALMKLQLRNSITSVRPSFPPFAEKDYYDPRYILVPSRGCALYLESTISFTRDELRSLFPSTEHEKLDRYLERMSVRLGEAHSVLANPGEYNVLNGRPFIKVEDEFILAVPKLLWRALSTTFHYDLVQDSSYWGRYIRGKGEIAEKRVKRCFAKIFGQVFTKVRYGKRKGWPDIDLIVQEGEATLLVECTSKWIRQKSKGGDLSSLTDDLKQSIEKCYKQLLRGHRALVRGEIGIPPTKQILPIIIVEDLVPGLERILSFFSILGEPYPYVINIYDLDIISDLTTGKEFVDFVLERIELTKKRRIFAADEIDYYVLYKTRGFEKLTEMLGKGNSVMFYIGHIENLHPTYYGEKLRDFLNDPQLEAIIGPEAFELATGWS